MVETSDDLIKGLLADDISCYESLPLNVQGFVKHIMDNYFSDLLTDIDRTESPVEQLFLLAANEKANAPKWSLFKNGVLSEQILVTPQYPVNIKNHHYRVDFGISYYSGHTNKYSTIFVEIDGHDFHERTKEQVTHDKQRERLLVNKCDSLIRFTGSEIYKDPYGCVSQAFQLAKDKYYQK